jgi:hypothetical protein
MILGSGNGRDPAETFDQASLGDARTALGELVAAF